MAFGFQYSRIAFYLAFLIICTALLLVFSTYVLQGGGAEKVKEEKRQLDLEDNYKFVWNKEDGIANEERTDSDESDRDPFFMKNNL